MEAWIEISMIISLNAYGTVASVWRRGLKSSLAYSASWYCCRLRMEAWIEISCWDRKPN